MNARELLHKGYSESDGDGILALSGGEEEKQEKEREKKRGYRAVSFSHAIYRQPGSS